MSHLTPSFILRRLALGVCFGLFSILLSANILVPPVSAGEPESLEFAGASRAWIYDAELVLEEHVAWNGDKLRLEIPGYAPVELLQSVATDDSTYTEFFPHDPAEVKAALAAVVYPNPVGELRIVLLPYPRAGIPSSSTAGDLIFLSPGIRPIAAEVTHMMLTHELGHAFHNERMPDQDHELWTTYRGLRGIADETVYSEHAAHNRRPHEIFAEDFRYLFGGPLAKYSGSIENGDLPLPDAVAGLPEFFLSLGAKPSLEPAPGGIMASVHPNPFNPRTWISVSGGSDDLGKVLSVQVFDATGRMIRSLHQGRLESPRMDFAWDGRDQAGREMPAGAYFSQIRLGDERVCAKMILLK